MENGAIKRNQAETGIGRPGLVEPVATAGKITGLDGTDTQQRHSLGIAGPVRKHGFAQGTGPGEIIGQAQLPGFGQSHVLHYASRYGGSFRNQPVI
jgi:hypothetical protein